VRTSAETGVPGLTCCAEMRCSWSTTSCVIAVCRRAGRQAGSRLLGSRSDARAGNKEQGKHQHMQEQCLMWTSGSGQLAGAHAHRPVIVKQYETYLGRHTSALQCRQCSFSCYRPRESSLLVRGADIAQGRAGIQQGCEKKGAVHQQCSCVTKLLVFSSCMVLLLSKRELGSRSTEKAHAIGN
jgi:hypothetical protein